MKQDADYLEASLPENELNEQYKKLDLSDAQRKVITQWIKAIRAQKSAHTTVVFRMGMQYCFSLLMQLKSQHFMKGSHGMRKCRARATALKTRRNTLRTSQGRTVSKYPPLYKRRVNGTTFERKGFQKMIAEVEAGRE